VWKAAGAARDRLCEQDRRKPVEIPVATRLSSILTSSVTLISTSTNLVASGLFTRYQQQPIGMFELAPVGIPVAVLGILYVWLIGVRLIQVREDQKAEEKIGEPETTRVQGTLRLAGARPSPRGPGATNHQHGAPEHGGRIAAPGQTRKREIAGTGQSIQYFRRD
jgi:hypothetical protein